MKHLQDTETGPVAYDTEPRITISWMTENPHQHYVNAKSDNS